MHVRRNSDDLGRSFAGLEQEVNNEMEGIRQIKVGRSESTLELSIDLGTGFDGYETVTVAFLEGVYSLSYFGLYSCAFGTFLRHEYVQDIAESELLTRLATRVERIRRKGEYEVDDESEGVYYRMVVEEVESGSYREIEEAIRFFCRVFKDKVGARAGEI